MAETSQQVIPSASSYEINNENFKYNSPFFITVPEVVYENDNESKISESREEFDAKGESSEEDSQLVSQSDEHLMSGNKFLMDDGQYTLFIGGEEQVEAVLNLEAGFSCIHCGILFSKKMEMLNHKRTVHNVDKFYQCPVCMRSFTQRSNMKAHIRVHTGEKPFKCEYCGRCFAQKSNLVNHVPIHTKKKPYKCQLCEKYFIQKSNLKSHVLTHTGEKPFKCDQCNKSFIQKSNLVCHYRIHTQEKPHKCDVCLKLFSQKSNLLNHMRIHETPVSRDD